MSSRVGILMVAVVAAGGCGARSKPVVEFPSAATLAAIQARPSAPPSITAPSTPTFGWEVAAQPAMDPPWQPRGPWDEAFLEAAASRRLRVTGAQSCTAGEVGRYLMAHQTAPPDDLRRFMAGACGSPAPIFGFNTIVDLPAPPAGDLLAKAKEALKASLLAALPAGVSEVGFSFQSAGDKGVAVVVYTLMAATLEPFSLVPNAGGEVILEGRLTADASYVEAFINRGRLAVQACYVDPGVPRPRFRVICQMDPDDETDWVQVLYAEPRRVLAHPFAQVLARHAADQPLPYLETKYAEPHVVANAEEFGHAVVADLNKVRDEANLSPVHLCVAQSAVATALAGHYFDDKASAADNETIALGLLAGWQVAGMIRDGSFVSSVVPHTRDPGRWLSATLALPLGRTTLLQDDIEEVALGPVLLDKPEAVAAVVTGYRLHHGNDHTSDVKRLLTRAALARRHLKLPAPSRMMGLDKIIREELAKVNTGEAEPLEALQEVLDRGVAHWGTGMHGYVLEATSLDALEIPAELLQQKTLDLEFGVTHHKPRGAAWAQLVIVVVYADYVNESIRGGRPQ